MADRFYGVLNLLNLASFGAYAMDLAQEIRFWNHGAERILGYNAGEVVGRLCYQVLHGVSQKNSVPSCLGNCPSILRIKEARLPYPFRVRVLCASGQRKEVTLTPVVISAARSDEIVLVHLIHELSDDFRTTNAGRVQDLLSGDGAACGDGGHLFESKSLTHRELQVLQLTAAGLKSHEIAGKLSISYNTVRNHLSNMRRKLNVTTKMEMVRVGRNLGMVEPI